jgi:hypothetical protein
MNSPLDRQHADKNSELEKQQTDVKCQLKKEEADIESHLDRQSTNIAEILNIVEEFKQSKARNEARNRCGGR